MFHRTAKIHNQYTMAPLQDPYVEIAYWDPNKNPSNTVYKEHAVRVLAEQASVILGNGDLLPRSEETWNDTRIRAGKPQGLDLTMWNIPILSIWGKLDKMMPESQIHRFRLMAAHINHRRKVDGESSNLRFEFRRLAKAGHFATSDQPKDSAEALLTWIEGIVGLKRLATAFLGFDSIARQDEKQIIATYSTLDEFQAV
jgi:pimeloyl-ACP methyl ester carboxylesterase